MSEAFVAYVRFEEKLLLLRRSKSDGDFPALWDGVWGIGDTQEEVLARVARHEDRHTVACRARRRRLLRGNYGRGTGAALARCWPMGALGVVVTTSCNGVAIRGMLVVAR